MAVGIRRAARRCSQVLSTAVRSTPSPYYLSKAAGEDEIRKVIDRGLYAVIINPAALLGPYDFGPSRMGQVLLDRYHGKMRGLVADGFDWVDVREVAVGGLSAAERGRTGENYLLGGHWVSMAGIGAVAEAITGIAAAAPRRADVGRARSGLN